MADELNVPTHRWYQARNHIKLPPNAVSKKWIYANGVALIDAWINSQPWGNPVPALFAAGEPGAWYDPSDLSTMFQDSAGTTPVTAAGQPVGLRLDKSKGLVLGPELVTNGDFATDTGWTLGGNWSISGGTLNGAAATSYSHIQAIGLNPSKTYRLLVSVTVSIGSVAINVGGINEVAFTSSGQKTATLLLDPSAIPFVYVSGSNFTGTIDNISVRELPGFHAVANPDAARGIYGIEPLGGRRNLLTYTEQFDDGDWYKSGVTVTSNATTAPDLTATADRIVFNTTSDLIVQDYTTTVDGNYTVSLWLRSATSTTVVLRIQQSGGALTNQVCNVTTDWQRFSVSLNVASSTFVRFALLANSNTPDVFAWGAQLETGSTATPYQRVVSQYEVTEAGKPTLHYVQYDGVDDSYVTPTITPGTDKVQVFAGVRKLSDAAIGMVCEFSPNINTNNGTFWLAAPIGNGVANYDFASKGTVGQSRTRAGFSAPITNVLTGIGDIGGDVSNLRVNGSDIGVTTADQGTGNYLAYPLYIGRRGGTSLPFNGRDYGLIVRFGPNLSTAQIASVEDWLNTRTGAY